MNMRLQDSFANLIEEERIVEKFNGLILQAIERLILLIGIVKFVSTMEREFFEKRWTLELF